ncbi:MAG: phosphate ABC transporter permease subunit PstC [Dehalococcoidia bacterium]|nr:phosphate ABC transporter permease subunit PstC [Dehalococcoidia bacterium]
MSRYFVDRASRHIVSIFGIVAFLILVFIAIFILKESLPALKELRVIDILFGTKWYPSHDAFGILTMLAGSVVTTLLALVIAVPLALGCAIFLAEVAPVHIRNIARPAVELLVGIPSVVYGLVGMVILSPVIARLSGTGSGSSVLAAAIVLAIMVLPTITSISEDSLRAVPVQYKEGAFALGATHWQTIHHVLLPAARRGITAAIILGTGRAIGETMAMIMVIGNSPIFPANIFGPARTLTGNIAVEIAAATGIHEAALFATGLVLFILVMLINSVGLLAYRRRA